MELLGASDSRRDQGEPVNGSENQGPVVRALILESLYTF